MKKIIDLNAKPSSNGLWATLSNKTNIFIGTITDRETLELLITSFRNDPTLPMEYDPPPQGRNFGICSGCDTASACCAKGKCLANDILEIPDDLHVRVQKEAAEYSVERTKWLVSLKRDANNKPICNRCEQPFSPEDYGVPEVHAHHHFRGACVVPAGTPLSELFPDGFIATFGVSGEPQIKAEPALKEQILTEICESLRADDSWKHYNLKFDQCQVCKEPCNADAVLNRYIVHTRFGYIHAQCLLFADRAAGGDLRLDGVCSECNKPLNEHQALYSHIPGRPWDCDQYLYFIPKEPVFEYKGRGLESPFFGGKFEDGPFVITRKGSELVDEKSPDCGFALPVSSDRGIVHDCPNKKTRRHEWAAQQQLPIPHIVKNQNGGFTFFSSRRRIELDTVELDELCSLAGLNISEEGK